MSKAVVPLESQLIEALHGERLPETLKQLRTAGPGDYSAAESELLDRAEASFQALRARCHAEGERLQQRLEDAGIRARFDAEELASSERSYALILIHVRPEEATRALCEFLEAGFLGLRPEHDPGWEISRRFGTQTMVIRGDEDYLRVVLRWRDPDWRSLLGPLTPSAEDVGGLPAVPSLWPLGLMIRPFRVLARRLGMAKRSRSFAPFLGTPRALLDPLLDLAEVRASDTVLDLGCGDATFLLYAAEHRNCRAIGYELEADIFARAQANLSASGLSARVALHHADARAADLTGVSVIFLFLPTGLLETLLPDLLARVDSGARIVVHEQAALPASLRPQRSRLVIAEDIMTVGHVWIR